jgi:hypothetical protein
MVHHCGRSGHNIRTGTSDRLLSMLKFAAHRYLAIGDTLNSISTSLGFPDFDHADILETKKNALASILRDLPRLREECSALGLRASVAQSEQDFYEHPEAQWKSAIERFPAARDDMEEASRCYSLERYGACVFHLMRITEAAVIELGRTVDPTDHKPQFSSVLKKIDHLVNDTKWNDWPEIARPYKNLFTEALPRLYAVKDSWRDKATHFELKIVPTSAMLSRERALDIYNCTVSLLRLLAEQMPPSA